MRFTPEIAQWYVSLLHEYIAGYRSPYGFSSKPFIFGVGDYSNTIRFVRDDVAIYFQVADDDFGSLLVHIFNDRLRNEGRSIFLR